MREVIQLHRLPLWFFLPSHRGLCDAPHWPWRVMPPLPKANPTARRLRTLTRRATLHPKVLLLHLLLLTMPLLKALQAKIPPDLFPHAPSDLLLCLLQRCLHLPVLHQDLHGSTSPLLQNRLHHLLHQLVADHRHDRHHHHQDRQRPGSVFHLLITLGFRPLDLQRCHHRQDTRSTTGNRGSPPQPFSTPPPRLHRARLQPLHRLLILGGHSVRI